MKAKSIYLSIYIYIYLSKLIYLLLCPKTKQNKTKTKNKTKDKWNFLIGKTLNLLKITYLNWKYFLENPMNIFIKQ